jgi:hypothetical protein
MAWRCYDPGWAGVFVEGSGRCGDGFGVASSIEGGVEIVRR